MKLRLKSIASKIFLIYISFAVINIAFFTVIIYENQIDLITENTVYKYKDLTARLAEALQLVPFYSPDPSPDSQRLLANATAVIDKNLNAYRIIDENGSVILFKGGETGAVEQDTANALKAVTGSEFSGRAFYTHLDGAHSKITFYMPIRTGRSYEFILVFSRSLSEINDSLKALYRQIAAAIIVLALLHICVAYLFYRILVKPVSVLLAQSTALSGGDFSARASISSGDEIGELAASFNAMADSIEEKVSILEKYRHNMSHELALAGDVQKLIYPELKKSSRFSFSLFCRPCGIVNGDYFDIFDLGENRFAFLIADVSGHGIPAALLTMTLKEKFSRYASLHKDPGSIFRMLNQEIVSMQGTILDLPHFFTGFYIFIDNDNTAYFCNAGHPQPVLASVKRNEVSLLPSGGGIVGLLSRMDCYFTTSTVNLEPGDKLLLCTDGIIEARNSENTLFGMNTIVETMTEGIDLPVSENVESILQKLRLFTDADHLIDDATIIGIELR